MFITVTPIGSSADDVSAAATAYVSYLCGGGGASGVSEQAAYYASGGSRILDGAGSWSGGGAEVLGLSGTVDRNDFEALLQGRHHRSAERLISARGSAGRVHLKAGQPTRLFDGEPLWGITDAAAAVQATSATVIQLVDPPQRVVVQGVEYVTMAGMRALLEAAGKLRPAVRLDDLATSEATVVSAGDVAEAVGVTRRYMTQLCNNIVDGVLEDEWGLAPHKLEGVWHVDRLGALQWCERREAPAVRVGYDMTLTTEKSLSVFGLLGDQAVREGTIEVLASANQTAVAWLDQMASTGRSKGAAVESHGLAVASFMHSTSRNDDPFLHVHNVVLNAIVDETNIGRALDATGLYAQAPAAAALATASMRRQLTDRFGVDWRLSGRDGWEIAGIDDTVIESFSTRRTEIEAAIAKLFDEPVDGGLRAEVSASTRGPKSGLTAAELAARWDELGTSLGYDSLARSAVLDARQPGSGQPLSERERTQLWRWLEAPEGVASNAACFDLGDVFWAIANWAPGGSLRLLAPGEIIDEAQAWLASQQVRLVGDESAVAAGGHRIGRATEPLWTTARILELQHFIAAAWDEGRASDAGLVPMRELEDAFASTDIELSAEQADLVRAWTTSGDAVQAAIGRPGTGKTTTMAVAVDAWEKAGFTVKGAAVKGEATRLLSKEGRVDASTVASLLARHRFGQPPVDAKTVLIVDEASTLSEWDLGALIAMCSEAGACLRLIGDPAQHTSVQAGGSWARLVEQFAVETPELRQQRRLTNPIEVEVTERVRAKEFDAAFSLLESLGHVERYDTWTDAYAPVIDRWWKLRCEGRSHPLVERTNASRTVLNTLAQAVRRRAGEIGPITVIGAKAFAIGDEVIAKEPNKELRTDRGQVLNGSTGVIADISDEALVVEFKEIGEVEVPNDWASRPAGIDLAYAVTSYSIQGASNSASTSVVRTGVSASELLVNLTRGRYENVLIAVGDQDNEFGAEPVDIAERVAQTVRVDDLRTVAERDPVAVALHQSGMAGQTLAEIARLAPGHDQDVIERAVEQRVAALRLAVEHSPGDELIALLGPRPSIRWQAARWDNLATDVMTFWDRWKPPASTMTSAGPDTALGAVTGDLAAKHRARLLDQIDTYQRSRNGVEIGL